MIRSPQFRPTILLHPQCRALEQDPVRPSGYPGFFTRIIGICPIVVFVRWRKSDWPFVIAHKYLSFIHRLEELVRAEKLIELVRLCVIPHLEVGHGDSIIEIRGPDHDIVVIDSLAPEEFEASGDRPVVGITLRHIAVSSSQVTRHEADGCVEELETYAHTAFISTKT